MKNIQLFIILIIITRLVKASPWAPITLANQMTSHLNDPDNFLSQKEFRKVELSLYQLMKDIKFYDIKVFIVNEIEKDDNNTMEQFLNTSAYTLYPDKNDKNSILIIFAIADRKMRIRAGENARRKFSDDKCVEQLNTLKILLRDAKYALAIEKLFIGMKAQIYMSPMDRLILSYFVQINLQFLLSFISLFVIILILFIYQWFKFLCRRANNTIIKKKLKKLNEIKGNQK
jgi:uncharacterized membrane protein YgcG